MHNIFDSSKVNPILVEQWPGKDMKGLDQITEEEIVTNHFPGMHVELDLGS